MASLQNLYAFKPYAFHSLCQHARAAKLPALEKVSGQVLARATGRAWATRDGRGEMFDKTRFMEVVRQHATRTTKGIVGAFHEAIWEFRSGESAEDDVTMEVVKA